MPESCLSYEGSQIRTKTYVSTILLFLPTKRERIYIFFYPPELRISNYSSRDGEKGATPL